MGNKIVYGITKADDNGESSVYAGSAERAKELWLVFSHFKVRVFDDQLSYEAMMWYLEALVDRQDMEEFKKEVFANINAGWHFPD